MATLTYGAVYHKIDNHLPAIRGIGIPPALANASFLLMSQMVALPMAQSLDKDLARPQRFRIIVWISFIIITISNVIFGKGSLEACYRRKLIPFQTNQIPILQLSFVTCFLAQQQWIM